MSNTGSLSSSTDGGFVSFLPTEVSNFKPTAYEEHVSTWTIEGYSWIRNSPARTSWTSPELLQASAGAKARLHFYPAGNTQMAYDCYFSSVALQVDPTFPKQRQMSFTVTLKSPVEGLNDIVMSVNKSVTLEDRVLKLNGSRMKNNMIPCWNFAESQDIPLYARDDDSVIFEISFKFWQNKTSTSANTKRPGLATERTTQHPSPDEGNQLAQALGGLLASRKLSDLVLCFGDTVLEAHRLVLAMNSPVFERMLFPSGGHGHLEATEGRVVIEDVDPGVARAFLEAIYTGKIPEEAWADQETMCDLLAVFHKYEVQHLVTRCEAHVASQLNARTVCERYMMAELLDLPLLRKEALKFITESTRRLAEVQATAGFQRLTQKRPWMLAEILGELAPPPKRLRSDCPN
jgi:hypothetical protein